MGFGVYAKLRAAFILSAPSTCELTTIVAIKKKNASKSEWANLIGLVSLLLIKDRYSIPADIRVGGKKARPGDS